MFSHIVSKIRKLYLIYRIFFALTPNFNVKLDLPTVFISIRFFSDTKTYYKVKLIEEVSY